MMFKRLFAMVMFLGLGSAVTAHAAPPSDPQAEAIFKEYLALHASLVAGDAGFATQHAAALSAVAAPAPALARSLVGYPKELSAQRKQFSAISDAAIALAAQVPKAAAGLNVIYCSMAPGRWLQRGTQVKNPYYGKDMLTCGEVEGPPKSSGKAGR